MDVETDFFAPLVVCFYDLTGRAHFYSLTVAKTVLPDLLLQQKHKPCEYNDSVRRVSRPAKPSKIRPNSPGKQSWDSASSLRQHAKSIASLLGRGM